MCSVRCAELRSTPSRAGRLHGTHPGGVRRITRIVHSRLTCSVDARAGPAPLLRHQEPRPECPGAGLGAGDLVPGATPWTALVRKPGRLNREDMISSYADVTSNDHHASVGDAERTGSRPTIFHEIADCRHGPPGAQVR